MGPRTSRQADCILRTCRCPRAGHGFAGGERSKRGSDTNSDGFAPGAAGPVSAVLKLEPDLRFGLVEFSSPLPLLAVPLGARFCGPPRMRRTRTGASLGCRQFSRQPDAIAAIAKSARTGDGGRGLRREQRLGDGRGVAEQQDGDVGRRQRGRRRGGGSSGRRAAHRGKSDLPISHSSTARAHWRPSRMAQTTRD